MSDSSAQPSKLNANVNSAIGNAKEAVGAATGYTELERGGKEQRTKADAEYKAAQAQGFVDGATDQLSGKFDRVKGAVLGDEKTELAGKARETAGATQKEANRP